jgi:hypothetical protein
MRTVVVSTIIIAWGLLAAGLLADEPASVDISALKILDVNGVKHALEANSRRTGTVFVFMSSECPISRQYVPELNRLHHAAASAAGEVGFYGIISDPTLNRRAAAQFVAEFKIAFPVLFDASGELAELLQPDHVPQAILVNSAGVIVYRGRIDDLYPEIGKRRGEPSRRDLLDAFTALAEKRPIPASRTAAVGCPFEARDAKDASAKVTYSRDIAPLLFAQCVECHRPGEVAPFSLLNYLDAAKRAEGISRVTSARLMPPWRAELNQGHFLDERRLSPFQIALIKTWAETGRAEGDPVDLPPAPVFTSDWRLGEPDLIVEAPVAFEVPADGPDIFQHFVIPTETLKEEMIVGFEFRPGNPAVVHHAIVFLDARGRARARDAETSEPGWKTSGSIDASITSMVGVWTPGMTPRIFSGNVGIPLDKGADVVLQLHIHPSGKAETDRSKVALYFAKKPVAKTMSRNPLLLGSLAIEIPPGEKRHKLSSKITLPAGLTLNSVLPHMHLVGKEMKVTATLPDGAVVPLIWIKDWSFYWQDSYVYSEPVHLPEGTQLEIEAYYDNSAENPFNPQSPPKQVLFGNDTTDEMCFALFQAVADEPGGMRKIGPVMMQSMMQEWNDAPISTLSRARIMVEITKLFGRGRRTTPPAAADQPKESK